MFVVLSPHSSLVERELLVAGLVRAVEAGDGVFSIGFESSDAEVGEFALTLHLSVSLTFTNVTMFSL